MSWKSFIFTQAAGTLWTLGSSLAPKNLQLFYCAATRSPRSTKLVTNTWLTEKRRGRGRKRTTSLELLQDWYSRWHNSCHWDVSSALSWHNWLILEDKMSQSTETSISPIPQLQTGNYLSNEKLLPSTFFVIMPQWDAHHLLMSQGTQGRQEGKLHYNSFLLAKRKWVVLAWLPIKFVKEYENCDHPTQDCYRKVIRIAAVLFYFQECVTFS